MILSETIIIIKSNTCMYIIDVNRSEEIQAFIVSSLFCNTLDCKQLEAQTL